MASYMKSALTLLMLAFSLTSMCQDNSLFITDSLIGILKVKTRTKVLYDSPNLPYIIDYYNENGKLMKTETIDPITDSPLTKTIFFYNTEWKLDSAIHSNCGKYLSSLANSLVINASNTKVFYLISKYKYDTNGIKEIVTTDDHNNLCFKTVYENISSKFTEWYDDDNKLFKITKSVFENNVVPLKDSGFVFNAKGDTLNLYVAYYKNYFNEKGQLLKSEYNMDKCKSKRKYSYFENGLVKSKRRDGCVGNWTFSYTYY
jgi:hypothetical protein